MLKLRKKTISIVFLALMGLISAFIIQVWTLAKVTGLQPQTQQQTTQELSCSQTATISPEDFSLRGKANYEIGRFDEAIDCWQKAVIAYRKNQNEDEAINNLINQAQAEQAMGLYPRACNTLLPLYGEKDCSLQIQDPKKRQQFSEKLEKPEGLIKLLNTPAKIAGLRLLANVFRGLGELDWSYQILVLLERNNKSLPEQAGAISLDLANTVRTLGNREQDFYSRNQQLENLNCAFTYASIADRIYQQAFSYQNQVSNSPSLVKIQAQLNRLSIVLDLIDWRNQINKETQEDIFQKFDKQYNNSSENIICEEWRLLPSEKKPLLLESLSSELTDVNLYGVVRQLANPNMGIPLQQIDSLQQQIANIPVNHTALFIKLNFARSLIRIQNMPDAQIENLLATIIKQARDINDLKAESYGYGYLGELYEKRQGWKLAQENTQKALIIAQSLSTAASPSDIEYLWEWQLGRIYKSQLPRRIQAQTKQLKPEAMQNMDFASQMYQKAYLTLQSLRRELVAGNPDAQFAFQNDIESVYRDYVDLLLWDNNPDEEHLAKAREVIASLQAVELENFLRLACPEFNLEEIDQIIDQQPIKTAFLYPIVLDDRIEVILKLPNNLKLTDRVKEESKNDRVQNLKHYSTAIDQTTVAEQIKKLQINVKEYTFNAVINKLQLDLEEDYTFKDVNKEAKLVYNWLIKGAEDYLKDQEIETLVFALDTNLRNIPLAALVVDDNDREKQPKYLIDNYTLALAPRLEIPEAKALQGKGLKILAAGLKEQEINPKKYPKLNYVETEIKAIEEIPNSGYSVTKLIDWEFKIDKFKNEINTFDFRVLHLATHGEFSSSPEKTFLLAYDQPIKMNQVGEIFRKQAQRQPEPIEILMLSACETATGDKRATLGISGVGVRAGARSAIASLWTLDDQISVDFTKIFYKQLIDPKVTTKAQALQQAQKALKDLPGREHPRYWAPYILLGNWL
ncbi:CHAT domain-containing protein [Dendronalium sp. ChiSLP03b]|uniref:CHAT domain-containing protein n=1 Tax=Dendronalium sp. ChiSLP03b TaxID=3075381 RepID=UPI002AD1DDAF|nr:CHAT domain-containing protein [Dendronalium sp. ChiSLP03b]MDZ8208311.1 CHAT domain-containing protein [Dendronalium sp. ChiSLP03b]